MCLFVQQERFRASPTTNRGNIKKFGFTYIVACHVITFTSTIKWLRFKNKLTITYTTAT